MPRLKRATKPQAHTARTAKDAEDARERFKRIGTPRMNRAVHSIRLLGNLARPEYGYTPEDVANMRTTLNAEVSRAIAKFDKATAQEFRFEG